MSFKINYKHASSTPKDWEYKCQECKEVFTREFLTSEMPHEVKCNCGGIAARYISNPPRVALDPISGDHPGATRKWEKMRESHMKKEKKNLDNHGDYN